MAATRSCISRAALFVKVTAKISQGRALFSTKICASRVVNTRVLPVPAPAKTNIGPSSAFTANACSLFRFFK